jgi:hypothetical protein
MTGDFVVFGASFAGIAPLDDGLGRVLDLLCGSRGGVRVSRFKKFSFARLIIGQVQVYRVYFFNDQRSSRASLHEKYEKAILIAILIT